MKKGYHDVHPKFNDDDVDQVDNDQFGENNLL